MITLEEFTDSPFDKYPQLKTIWPEPSNTDMQEGYNSYIALMKEHPHIDWGPMYLIKKEDKVIGITGVFLEDGYPYNPETQEVHLRWHGIIPKERRQGYSDEAMTLLLIKIQDRYPKLQTLIELIPQRSYAQGIQAHFESLGFVAVGEAQKFDWADCLWQPYHLDVPKYLSQFDIHSNTDNQLKKKIKF
jgi:RimJ/RimL family protein N-acetyltransferase